MAEGTVGEGTILERARCKYADELGDAQDDARWKRIVLGSVRGVKVVMTGVCDAMTESLIVEIKKRKNRLFHKLAEYEHVQVQAYLQLYNYDAGVLLESFGEDMEKYDVARDDDMWRDVVRDTLEAVECAMGQVVM